VATAAHSGKVSRWEWVELKTKRWVYPIAISSFGGKTGEGPGYGAAAHFREGKTPRGGDEDVSKRRLQRRR